MGLFYQDFNEQFEGYTQLFALVLSVCISCSIRISMNNLKDIHNFVTETLDFSVVVLSGFQWTIWRIYTTYLLFVVFFLLLFYQDFNEQFEGYTQPRCSSLNNLLRCSIRISMNNLKDIHNMRWWAGRKARVVLSGFQWTKWDITILILPQNYKKCMKCTNFCENILLFHKKALPLHQQNLKDIHNKDYSVV